VQLPVPGVATGRWQEEDDCTKEAVTEVAAFIVTLQVPVPVQPPPLQPVKVAPAAGVAVRLTTVPVVKAVEQVAPQEIPAGALVTVPTPAPALVTLRAGGDCLTVAGTEAGTGGGTLQGPVAARQP